MVFFKLHASGIRGYIYYNWEPKKNDKLRLKCDEKRCLYVEKLDKKSNTWKKVGTVPTEFQKPFREFISLGGTITVHCVSDIPRRNASNIMEIPCVYTIKGMDSQHLNVLFDDIKSATEEAAKTDKKIWLEDLEVKPGKRKQKDDSVNSEQATSSASESQPVKKKRKQKDDSVNSEQATSSASESQPVKKKRKQKDDSVNLEQATSSASESQPVKKKRKQKDDSVNLEQATSSASESQPVKRKQKDDSVNLEQATSSASESQPVKKKIKQKDDSVNLEQATSSASESQPVKKKVEKRKLSKPTDGKSKIKKLKKNPGTALGTDEKRNSQKEILTDQVTGNKPKGGGDEKEIKSSKETSNKAGEKVQVSIGEPGRNYYKKSYDNSQDQIMVEALSDKMKSVGVLISAGDVAGTVFRVGTDCIMTARHVVRNVIDPFKSGQPDTRILQDKGTYVHFKAHAINPPEQFYYLSKDFLENTDLDVAILKIVNPDNLPRKMPLLNHDVNTDKVSLIGFGHPEKGNKKCLESGCTIIKQNSTRIWECYAWLKEFNLELKENILNKEVLNGGYCGIDDPSKLIFDCYMEHGASGAPVLAYNGWAVYVISMLTHGLPSFFFDLPNNLRCRVENKYRLEVGTKMKYIFDWLKSTDPALAQDIFS